MNLILIGMMGSGKSSVGKLLADHFGMKFIDTDALIEEMQGLTIAKIFELYGEKHFRHLETELLEKLSDVDDAVISTGGGMVLNPWHVILLRKMGRIVYLMGSVEQLSRNLDGVTANRPMLKDNRLEVLLKVREPIYRNSADRIVEIDGKNADEVMRDIVDEINT